MASLLKKPVKDWTRFRWLCTCRDSYQEFELESDKRKPSDNGLIEKWKKHITLRVRVLKSRGGGGREGERITIWAELKLDLSFTIWRWLFSLKICQLSYRCSEFAALSWIRKEKSELFFYVYLLHHLANANNIQCWHNRSFAAAIFFINQIKGVTALMLNADFPFLESFWRLVA